MDLVNRLKYFLESNNIAISQFADTCRIPRPTLSQILSGRNKKISDELITKIHTAYPELSVLWLMFGEGEMESKPNIEISEAQNSTPAPYQTPQSAQYQTETEQSDEDSLFAYGRSENSDTDGFDTKSLAVPYDQPANGIGGTGADNLMPENSISFFVDYSAPAAKATTTDAQQPRSNAQPLHNTATTEADQPTHQADQPAEPAPDMQHPASASAHDAGNAPKASIPLSGGGSISLQSPAGKKITNIVVFYSDNSFQSFSPTV